MIRLRAGNAQRYGVVPGGSSDEDQAACPRSAGAAGRGRGGYACSGPQASTAIVAAAGVERALVRRGVDPERHAADDRQPRRGAAAAEIARDREALVRRAARTDDRHARARRARASSRGGVRPDHVQHRGRIGKVEQRRRIDRRRSGRSALRRRADQRSRSGVGVERLPLRAELGSARAPPSASISAASGQREDAADRRALGAARARGGRRAGRSATSAAGSRRTAPLTPPAPAARRPGGTPAARSTWPRSTRVAPVEVGDRPRDAQQAVAAARADRAALVEDAQRAQRAVARRGAPRAAPPGESSALRQPARCELALARFGDARQRRSCDARHRLGRRARRPSGARRRRAGRSGRAARPRACAR